MRPSPHPPASATPDLFPTRAVVLPRPPFPASAPTSAHPKPPRPAESSRSRRGLTQEIPPLLQHGVHVLIERSQRLIDGLHAPYRLLTMLEDGSCDLLPLRHLRRRHHPPQLIPKRQRIPIVRQRRILPRTLPRRQITSELIEPQLNRWLRQIFHQLPRFVLVLRRSE